MTLFCVLHDKNEIQNTQGKVHKSIDHRCYKQCCVAHNKTNSTPVANKNPGEKWIYLSTVTMVTTCIEKEARL